MKKMKILTRSIPQTHTTFEDFYEDISSGWRQKAEKLQARRWYKINHRVA